MGKEIDGAVDAALIPSPVRRLPALPDDGLRGCRSDIVIRLKHRQVGQVPVHMKKLSFLLLGAAPYILSAHNVSP